ncbi:O-methyltransferase family 2 [Penicillium lagena]|uniref:O-methyltransferase family 2 n=1 Tax=Penicillium lagena TaxID=94218 RepID=UPI0025421E43|nr:O-methyltransferase family 2 [Penicillium lagena]KAJ5602205.1 O-methyltransferase family 2 [Penicillium lagena]
MAFLQRLAQRLGLSRESSPVVPPGAALAATVTVVSLFFVSDQHEQVIERRHSQHHWVSYQSRPATADEVAAACNQARSKNEAQLGTRLAADTLYIMAGLGLVDRVDEDCFAANAITKHMDNMPSAEHGALHFTTEGLMAGAFLMKKLEDTNFEYPFADADGPLQYAYRLMGKDDLAQEHTYSIMEKIGRMDSFNEFMVGKFLKFGTMPQRVKSFGYDLDAALAGDPDAVAMVDIGGGRGELLLEVQAAYPHLRSESLVVQEFNAEIDNVPGVRLMEWNYKEPGEQPIKGARVYSLQHIVHNLPDLDAAALLQKISRAMGPESRLLIHEYAKNMTYTSLHANMIALYGGRERSAAEWRQLASVAGLEVTFEAYAKAGESLVEMRRADRDKGLQ